MAEVVGWDLDSSVCSTMHRRHLIPEIRAGRATWDEYAMLCLDDTPVEGAVALMNLMFEMDPRVEHVAISGRSEGALKLTRDWSDANGVPFDRYMLRPAGDHTPNGKWKVKCIRQLRAEGHTVRVFFEDWDQTAKYIREHTGVPVVGLNPFDEGSALVTRESLAAELERELESRYGRGHDHETGACHVGGKELAAGVFGRLGGAW